jgi:hypothetical protein
MALEVEIVVDGSVHIEKALGRSSRLEPLQFPLSSSHGLVGILGAIVRPQSLLMRTGQAQVPESRSVGAELVGRQQFWREASFPEQLAHQSECRALVAAALHQHIENLTLVIDGAPQVHPFGDANYHLVEVPSIARARAGASEPAGKPGPELQNPPPHRFVGNLQPTLGQEFLDVAVA